MSTWIRQETRISLYIRDSWRCIYCQDSALEGAILTLDHLQPRVLGGTHEPRNLVTACMSCNSLRRSLPVWQFVASFDDVDGLRERIQASQKAWRSRRRELASRAEARAVAGSAWWAQYKEKTDTRGHHDRAPEAALLTLPAELAPTWDP